MTLLRHPSPRHSLQDVDGAEDSAAGAEGAVDEWCEKKVKKERTYEYDS